MSTVAVGPFELILMLILSGSPGAPMGVPPGPEDPLLSKVAPADCLFYTSWASTGTASGSSTNTVEKLLSEPKVKEFQSYLTTQVETQIKEAVAASSDPKLAAIAPELQRLVDVFRRRATAVFIEDVAFGEEGAQRPPKIKAGVLVNLEGDSLKVRAALDKIVSTYGIPIETREINKTKFSELRLDPEAPVLNWAIAGKYFILGIGEGSAEGILSRGRGEIPGWLSAARRRWQIPRISTVSYLNIPKVLAIAKQVDESPVFENFVKKFGVDRIGAGLAVSGLNEKHFLSRASLQVSGEPIGLLSWLNLKPLTSDALKPIPATAPVAGAMRMDQAAIFDAWLSVIREVAPDSADQMEAGIKGFEQKSGINVRSEILQGLGDTWTVYADPLGGGVLSGWTIRVAVRDFEKLSKGYKALMTPILAANTPKQGQPPQPGAPSVRASQVAGKTAYTLTIGAGLPIPMSPSWCLTEKELLISLNARALQNALGPAPSTSFADNPDVSKLVNAETSPLAVASLDMKQLMRSLYPVLQLAQASMAQATGKAPFDITKLPPIEVLEKHLSPSTYSLSRVPDGVEYVSDESVPGLGPQASMPVLAALMLPAVQSSRTAADRVHTANNLKEIGLGLHNYSGTHGAFPAAYSADSSGKPLLSWRVHLLPFVENDALYREFKLDEPWDSPHNIKLVERMPDVYKSTNEQLPPGKTSLLGAGGKGSLFEPPGKIPESRVPKGLAMQSIRDGTTNTIAVLQVTPPASVIWTKPDDLDVTRMDLVQTLAGSGPNTVQVLMCDGSIRQLPKSIDRALLRAMFTVNGMETLPPIGR